MAQQQTVLSFTETYNERSRKTYYVLRLGCGCEVTILKAKGMEKPPGRRTCYTHPTHVVPGGEQRSDPISATPTTAPTENPILPTTSAKSAPLNTSPIPDSITTTPTGDRTPDYSANLAGCDRDWIGRQPDNPDWGKPPTKLVIPDTEIPSEPDEQVPSEELREKLGFEPVSNNEDAVVMPMSDDQLLPILGVASDAIPVAPDVAEYVAPPVSESVTDSAPTDPTRFDKDGRIIIDSAAINRAFARMYPSSKPL